MIVLIGGEGSIYVFEANVLVLVMPLNKKGRVAA